MHVIAESAIATNDGSFRTRMAICLTVTVPTPVERSRTKVPNTPRLPPSEFST